MLPSDRETLDAIGKRGIPRLIVSSKCDLPPHGDIPEEALPVSTKTGFNIKTVLNALAALMPEKDTGRLIGDLVSPGDLCVLVCPIDESAPKGRLILPQQMAIRDLMDSGAVPVVTRDSELALTLDRLGTKPRMVVTDSQAFGFVAPLVPQDIPLTSFSILMARYKGFLRQAVDGIARIDSLRDGDLVLMAEGCTHHRQCNDIGTVKIPNWLRKYTGKDIHIRTCSGRGFPEDLTEFSLVVHCGACMLTEQQLQDRMAQARSQGVPCTNYGTAIAYMNGILERSLRLFPQIHAILPDTVQVPAAK